MGIFDIFKKSETPILDSLGMEQGSFMLSLVGAKIDLEMGKFKDEQIKVLNLYTEIYEVADAWTIGELRNAEKILLLPDSELIDIITRKNNTVMYIDAKDIDIEKGHVPMHLRMYHAKLYLDSSLKRMVKILDINEKLLIEECFTKMAYYSPNK